MIYKNFLENCRSNPNKIALICDDQHISYLDLLNRVEGLAGVFKNLNIDYGDHLVVILPNSIEFVVLLLVACKLGVTLVPVNPSIDPKSLSVALDSVDAKFVIGNSSTININDSTQNFINIDEVQWEKFHNQTIDKSINSPYLEKVSGDEPLILTLTSGSTGHPKPIILTQKNKYLRALSAISLYNIRVDDIILAATPLYHSLAERLVIIPLILGATGVILSRFSVENWIESVNDNSVTFTIAVSSQLSQISKKLDNEFKINFKTLRSVVSSSALLDLTTREDLIKKFECDFHECYGTSETAIITNINVKDDYLKIGSVGRGIPEAQLQIRKENGEIAKPFEHGEIFCKTSLIFGGYYNQLENTRNSMLDDFFMTGDIGYLDHEGFLYFIDRKKDIVITGGINVYPSDIESVIKSLEFISECVVFSCPDDKLGEAVGVAITPKSAEAFLRNIKIHCAKNLSDYQQPAKYFFSDSIPKNSMGKIARRLVLEKYLASNLVNK